MSAKTIDLLNVISVTITPTPTNLGVPVINTVALISSETPSWGDAFRIYVDATTVGVDFGTNTKAFAIATAFFAQQPNPLGTGGSLVIIPRQSSGSESIQAAILRTFNTVYYFGILIDQELNGVPSTFSSLTAYIQTLDKLFFYASSQTADYQPGGLLDLVRSSSQTHTRCLYYNDGTALDTQLMAAAYASRGLSVNFTGSNTVLTMNLKSLVNIVPDTTVDQTALAAIQAAGVDCYVNIGSVSGSVPVLMTSGLNTFFDEVYNEFWFKFALQTAGFNFLRSASGKVPQTEIGMSALKGAYRAVCRQAITNGYAAPGAWTSATTFGDAASLIRSIGDVGFYVWSSPVALQTTADRAARKAPLVQIAVKTAGAIHSSAVIVEVNI